MKMSNMVRSLWSGLYLHCHVWPRTKEAKDHNKTYFLKSRPHSITHSPLWMFSHWDVTASWRSGLCDSAVLAWWPPAQAKASARMKSLSSTGDADTKSLVSRDRLRGLEFCFAIFYWNVQSEANHHTKPQFSHLSSGDYVT